MVVNYLQLYLHISILALWMIQYGHIENEILDSVINRVRCIVNSIAVTHIYGSPTVSIYHFLLSLYELNCTKGIAFVQLGSIVSDSSERAAAGVTRHTFAIAYRVNISRSYRIDK